MMDSETELMVERVQRARVTMEADPSEVLVRVPGCIAFVWTGELAARMDLRELLDLDRRQARLAASVLADVVAQQLFNNEE